VPKFNVDLGEYSPEEEEEGPATPKSPLTPSGGKVDVGDYTPFEGLTFDNLSSNKELMEVVRDYYRDKDGDEFATDEDAADQFVNQRVRSEQNLTFGTLPEYFYADDDETPQIQKDRLSTMREAWGHIPDPWEEGGRGWIEATLDNVGEAALDPVSWFGGGVGGMVAKKAAQQGLKKLASTAAGLATTGAIETGVGTALNLAHQGTEIEVGLRDKDNLDLGQAGLAGIIQGIAGTVPGAAGMAIFSKLRPGYKIRKATETTTTTTEAKHGTGTSKTVVTTTKPAGTAADVKKFGKLSAEKVALEKEAADLTASANTKLAVGDDAGANLDLDRMNMIKDEIAGIEKQLGELTPPKQAGDMDVVPAPKKKLTPTERKMRLSEDTTDPLILAQRASYKSKPGKLAELVEKVKYLGSWPYVRQKVLDSYTGVLEFEAKLSEKSRTYTYLSGPIYRGFRLAQNVGQATVHVLEHGGIRWENSVKLKIPGKDGKLTGERFGDLVEAGPAFVDALKHLEDAPGGVLGGLNYVVSKRLMHIATVPLEGKKKPRKVPYSMETLKATILDGDNITEYQAFLKTFHEYNKNLLDFVQQSGIISAEDVARMSKHGGQWYVPLYRLLEGTTPGKQPKGVTVRGMSKLTGSAEPNIADTMENIVKNAESMVTAAIHNATKRNLFDAIVAKFPGDKNTAAGIPGVVTRLPARAIRSIVSKEDLGAYMKKQGLDIEDFNEAVSEEFIEFYRRSGQPRGDNIEMVMRDGKAEYWQVDDALMLESLQSLSKNGSDLPAFIRWAGKYKRLFTASVTYEPTFVLRNALRDTGSSFVLGRGNSVRNLPVVNILQGVGQGLWKGKEYREFILNGGGFSSIRSAEAGTFSLKDSAWYLKHGVNPNSIIASPRQLRDAIVSSFRAYSRGLSRMENATRFSEFQAMRKKRFSRQESGFAARDSATDFSMHGSSTFVRAMTTVVPFLNPGMQGAFHTARRLKQDPVTVGFKAFASMTVPALMLREYNKDYDVIRNTPDHVKDTHLLFPVTKDGELWPEDQALAVDTRKIPISYDAGAIFQSAVVRLMDRFDPQNPGDDENAELLYHFYKIVVDQMLIDPTPVFFGPMAMQDKNEKFGGSPIVPPSMSELETILQKRPTTNRIAVRLGELTGKSPLRIEQFFKDMTASSGTLILDGVDRAWRMLDHDQPVLPELPIDRYPVMKAIMANAPFITKDEIEFYRLIKALRVPDYTLGRLESEGNLRDIEYVIKNIPGYQELAELNPELAGITKELSAGGKAIRHIQEDLTMDAGPKRVEIEGYRKQVSEAITGLMKVLREDPLLLEHMREDNKFTAVHKSMKRLLGNPKDDRHN